MTPEQIEKIIRGHFLIGNLHPESQTAINCSKKIFEVYLNEQYGIEKSFDSEVESIKQKFFNDFHDKLLTEYMSKQKDMIWDFFEEYLFLKQKN